MIDLDKVIGTRRARFDFIDEVKQRADGPAATFSKMFAPSKIKKAFSLAVTYIRQREERGFKSTRATYRMLTGKAISKVFGNLNLVDFDAYNKLHRYLLRRVMKTPWNKKRKMFGKGGRTKW